MKITYALWKIDNCLMVLLLFRAPQSKVAGWGSKDCKEQRGLETSLLYNAEKEVQFANKQGKAEITSEYTWPGSRCDIRPSWIA